MGTALRTKCLVSINSEGNNYTENEKIDMFKVSHNLTTLGTISYNFHFWGC